MAIADTHGTRLIMSTKIPNTTGNPLSRRYIARFFNVIVLHSGPPYVATIIPFVHPPVTSWPKKSLATDQRRQLLIKIGIWPYHSPRCATTASEHSLEATYIPSKVELFLWLLSQDKFLTNRNLRKKNWLSGDRYVLCSTPLEENTDHLFFPNVHTYRGSEMTFYQQ
jgi:zinc-binding in reverse transcriptase